MISSEWVYDYETQFTPQQLGEILQQQPPPYALPEHWDWFLFLVGQALLRVPRETTQATLPLYKSLQKSREKAWALWREIKKEAEARTGASVLTVPEFAQGQRGLSRAYIDTIYVPAIRSRR